MEEWKEYKLHEIGRIVGGATPPTKDSANYDGEISWITPKDLSNFTGRYIQKGERFITKYYCPLNFWVRYKFRADTSHEVSALFVIFAFVSKLR